MRKQFGQNRRKDSRKRGRSKLRWKKWLVYGPIIALLVACTLGYYIIDLYQHPSLWNGIVFVVVIVFGMIVFLWPKRKRR